MLNFTLKYNGHQQLEWYWLFGESQPNNSRVRWRFSTNPVILLGILYCNAHQIAQYQVSQTCHEHIPKVITLPSRPRHPRLHSNIFDAAWGHFFCVTSKLFRTTWCSFTTCLSSRRKLTGRFASKKHSEFVLIIFYLQLINSAHADSFPLEDKHDVNEHREKRKSNDATQEKLPSWGAFQCTKWLVWNKLAASKMLLWRRQKNSWVSRSTGKSNIKSRALSEGCHNRNTLRRVSRYEHFKNAVS